MKKLLAIALMTATPVVAQTTEYVEVPVISSFPLETQIQVKTPRQVCTTVQTPVYETHTERGGDDLGKTIIGGVLGGVIGHQIDHDAGAPIGAILGGAIANERQKDQNSRTVQSVVGHRNVEQCRTEYTTHYETRRKGYRVVIQLPDGTGRTLTMDRDPGSTVTIRQMTTYSVK